MRRLGLTGILFGFWLVLSGHYTPFLVTCGVLASVISVAVAVRLGVVDEEAQPMHLFVRALTYVPWLLWEIARSAWGVTRIILHPKLPISPTMTVVRASQTSAVGVATYGNSITLTPGTVTAAVEGNRLTVHALVRDGALDLESGRMDARVTRFEGSD